MEVLSVVGRLQYIILIGRYFSKKMVDELLLSTPSQRPEQVGDGKGVLIEPSAVVAVPLLAGRDDANLDLRRSLHDNFNRVDRLDGELRKLLDQRRAVVRLSEEYNR